jgi:hypothetical protein
MTSLELMDSAKAVPIVAKSLWAWAAKHGTRNGGAGRSVRHSRAPEFFGGFSLLKAEAEAASASLEYVGTETLCSVLPSLSGFGRS